MQVHKHFLILICLVAASGCSKRPEAVFVDLSAVLAHDQPNIPPKASAEKHLEAIVIPSKTVTLPRSTGITLVDKAQGKIATARRLIEADREAAKKTLSRRLGEIQNKDIDDAKRKALEELYAQQAKYLDTVYDQLYAIFQKYAKERGGKSLRLEVLKAKKPSIFSNRMTPVQFAERRNKEIEDLRKVLADMDEAFDGEAEKLLIDAELKLSAEQGALQAKYETLRANALEQADRQARQTIDKATGGLVLDLGQNRSVTVNGTGGKTLTVPGSVREVPGVGPSDVAQAVTGAEERKQQVEQQLEIWLNIRGYARANRAGEGRNATDEFEAWRKTHRLGP